MDDTMLKAMGFSEAQVTKALAMTNGDIETALELLLSGAFEVEEATATIVPPTPPTSSSPSSSTSSIKLTTLAISQYSFPNGTSACTAIAITTMADLLTKLDNNTICGEASAMDFIPRLHNEAKLSQHVINGIAEYDKYASFSSVSSEHLTADEFFAATESLWSTIKKLSTASSASNSESHSEPLQRNLSDPDAIASVFREIRSSSTVDRSKYVGVVLTKPPETILVILPPPDTQPSITNNDAIYLLFDSHARPQLGIEGAYFYTTTSELDLIQRVQMTFPVVDLGLHDCPTDGSLLADLYNTIEANAYQSFEDSTTSTATATTDNESGAVFTSIATTEPK